MQVSKKTKILNFICVMLVLTAGVIRLVAKPDKVFAYNGLIFTMFSFAAVIWIFQLQKRLLQPDVRHNLISAAGLMIFWMALRTVKYDLLPTGHFTVRYAWYLFYLPMLFIPLLIFLSVLAIGRPHDKPINPKWYLLALPTSLVTLGVLTNDLHENAFRFINGLENWYENNITYGFAYYAAIIWMILLFFAIIVTVFIRCSVSKRKKKIILPLLILLVGFTYMLGYSNLIGTGLIYEILTMPEMTCFVFAAFTESLICVHLLPSNDNYETFWNASSIGAGIMDERGVIRYKSEKSCSVTLKQVCRAQDKAMLLKDGDISLHSHAVRGGYGYWTRDISEINRLNSELKDLGDVTAQENAMLEAENKIESDRIRIEEQNKLYDDMAKGVKKQLDLLGNILDSLPEDESEFEKTMKYACILNAYVKRHSNLILLAHQSDSINSEELRHCINESLEYVQLNGIKTQCFFDGTDNISNGNVLLAHELFEETLESSIPGAEDILVYVCVSENRLIMRTEIHTPTKTVLNDCIKEKISSHGGTLETEFDDNTQYIALTLSDGGDGI